VYRSFQTVSGRIILRSCVRLCSDGNMPVVERATLPVLGGRKEDIDD
jgi:hypothetical protein